ncbi:MAG: hypothetical protein HY727_17980 [Candidatus Rokubacteria bacterium]|nr:hypothetical protein [Candidatus Rokubacteria bacterium]
MSRLAMGLVAGAAAVAPPTLAAACATCIASAYGDRTFNWAYVLLLAMPFVLTLAMGGVLAWAYLRHRGGSSPDEPRIDGAANLSIKETP